MDEYKTILRAADVEFVEKKSRLSAMYARFPRRRMRLLSWLRCAPGIGTPVTTYMHTAFAREVRSAILTMGNRRAHPVFLRSMCFANPV